MQKFFCITLIFALFAFQTTSATPKQEPLQYLQFNERNYKSTNIENVSAQLIKTIVNDYKANPWREKFDEIRLIRAFEDASNRKRFLKFSITYVSDIYVVYAVNEDNVITDKFLLSQW